MLYFLRLCRFALSGNVLFISLLVLLSSYPIQAHDYSIKPIIRQNSIWQENNVNAFEQKLETLRQRYHIPGISVGIVNNKHLVWKKGLGYADIEQQIAPDENTVYQIASLTKTFGSIILMQLVEAGKVSLDDPIAKYDINLGARWGSDERIKVKHLLTHTAMGNTWNGFKPGYTFRYNGSWYQELGKVIQKASGKSFGNLLLQNIILPLNLKNTVPSTDDSINFNLTGYDKELFKQKVAKPYDWQKKHLVPVQFTYGFGPAAGMMSTVSDLATYSNALDEQKFLNAATWQQIFTPFETVKGKSIQYGLGWYVTYYKGVKLLWHTGWWTGYSALLVKIPEKDLTFIALANSQDLSRPFYHLIHPLPMVGLFNPLRKNLNSNLTASDFAKAFIDHFAQL
ncbi:beta-lactamase family protein [Adhaeribacter swui]|uniref:Beta-lactamase family protein n=1 Tax=Adhaeribacter swui TaxID=2086471 RepID=A0A7G7G5M6_9BACT|nr:serine hydrolase domain-containing protein [Adhaeribacter swui]QNF32460.1 beta-lactamase family protein [Adhaeribacter swui]